jgi:hypothetical protein
MEREEQDLRAKLRREQDDRRHEDAWRSKAREERDLRGGRGILALKQTFTVSTVMGQDI